jgi:hypothetical protein
LPHSTTAALYKCAKVNIFHDHDLEKMFGYKQSCSLARLDTGWFWNNIANRSEGFRHQTSDKVKGDYELYGTGKDHHPLASVFPRTGAGFA